MRLLYRRKSASGGDFRDTFRNRKRSGSAEFLFAEVRNAFDPSSRVITTWQQVTLACILYELLVIQYVAVFAPDAGRSQLVGLYVCELVFCADIYVQLNTGYYEDGNVLRDTRKSRTKYLRSLGFVLDVLALLPLSLLPIQHTSLVFLEFHKLTRVRRLPQLISNLDNIYARYFVPLKLVKVLGITLLTSHFVACARFSFGYDTHHDNHWLPHVPDHEQHTQQKYLMSLFWAFGLLTGLFEGELPHTNAEFAFTIFVALCGFSLFTYLCATFFLLSKCESGDTETAEARVSQFQHILAFHRVPPKLQQQAVEYLKRYYTQADANDREAARLLCPSIASDIQIELLQDTVARIPVFEGCDTHFIKAVTSLLELISCPAHFVLFRAGDHGDAMYVVNSGVLYTVVNGVKVRELRKGSFFGEVAVLAKLPRSATMVTTTYSTLYRLSRFHVDKLLEGYPRYARLISSTVDRMLKTANSKDEDTISQASGVTAAAPKKKKSMLLQVVGLRAEQKLWRSKKSLAAVQPAVEGSTGPSVGSLDSASVASIRSQSPTADALHPERAASPAGYHLQALKVHPERSSADGNGAPVQTASATSVPLKRNSLFLASKRKMELFRDSFFRKGRVGPSDGKPQDVIRGFYDQLPQTAPPPPPTTHWWAALLRKKCIDAESRTRMVWLLCLQFILCYNWIAVPLQLAFLVLDDHIVPIAALNIVTDLVLWADVYGNFNLSYTLNAEKITDPVRSAKRYASSWALVLDLCCVWPYGMFQPSRFNSAVVRLPRLLRVWRLKGHFSEVESYTLMNSRKRLLFSGLILLMLYHIVACMHFSITHWEGFSHHEEAWIPSEDVAMEPVNATHFRDFHGHEYTANDPKVLKIGAMQYARSLYYAANVLAALGRTIEPASDRQYAIALGFMLSGFLITAIVVDEVQKRFTASAFEQKEFFATRTRIQLFLKRQSAPLAIHQRVNSFLDFWWSSHRGAIVQELLEELPTVIKRDIVKSICTSAVETLGLLRVEDPFRTSASNDMPDDVRQRLEGILLDNLRFVLYGQGEVIYRLGDHAGGLYFVLEGRVSVVPDGGYPYTVPLGGFFGTDALHLPSRKAGKTKAPAAGGTTAIGYSEHVTAVSGCIVVFISREHLLAMEQVFPSLPVSLHVLERKLRSAKVARTSDILHAGQTGPSVTSPTLQRSLLDARPTRTLDFVWLRAAAWLWRNQTSVDPDALFVGVWETWILVAMTAQCAIVVYHICFGVELAAAATTSRVFLNADVFTLVLESCFLLDMYLQSRLGYYAYGNKVMDIQTIRTHYFRSLAFALDAIALVPLYALNWFAPDVHARLELLNLNKLVRIFKAPSHFRSLESKYVKLATELRLVKLVYYTYLIAHVFGCIWFDFAANLSGLQTWIKTADEDPAKTTYFGDNAWLPHKALEHGSRSLQYFGSIFWSFGLMSASSTGELPKSVAQCFFSVTTMTSGFFLFAYVVGNFLDVIELQDSENREFVAKLSSMRHLLAHFKLPPEIQEKFKTFYFFKRFHSITQEHVLERVLPPSLLVDIRMFQLQPMIVKVAFLAGMDDSVTRMLVSLFTQTLYVKDEFICRFGEEGSEMFFIFTGMLDILIPASLLAPPPPPSGTSSPSPGTTPTVPPRANSKGVSSATLKPPMSPSASGASRGIPALHKVNEITAGSYFGEAALFTNAPRNAFVKAKTSCILYRLSRQSLELVFDRYPEWKKKVLRIVKIQQEQQRLSRMATEVQESDASSGAASRRRGLKRNLSRMDILNSRAEGIEELLLAHTRADKKKSLAFSLQQALLKTNVLPRVSAALKPALTRLHHIFALLVNGVEIQSRSYIIWVRLALLCTVFMSVFVPYRIVYDGLDRWNGVPVVLRLVECVCEAVYWLDIWFQFRVRSNQVAMELYEQDHLLAYKRERLVWDFAAAFPLDHFVVDFVFEREHAVARKWLRLNRCLKARNLVYYRNEIKRRSVAFELDRVKTLWLLYLLAIFWTSCAYFAVAMHDGFGTAWQAWLPAEELATPDPAPSLLLLRLFRGLMFGTTAFVKKGRTFVPSRTLDYAFSIFISFVGQLIMALMIGEMANVFILHIDNEIRFRKNHIAVEHYLARWRVSAALKIRANAFLTSWWSSYAGVDYQLVFADLPRTVRTEGVLFIAEKPLQLFMERVFRPLARSAGKDDASTTAMVESLVHSIAQHLRFEGYPRGESVVVEGSVCRAMYFVVRGYLFSKSASNPTLYHAERFRHGDYFGHIGLLGHAVSLMTVTSIRASDLFALDSERLLAIIQSHAYFQLVYKIALDAVRQKKHLGVTLASTGTSVGDGRKVAESLVARRTSAPVVGMDHLRAPSGAVSDHRSISRVSVFETHLSALLRVDHKSEWDGAFQLFVELILPRGTLNDLDGKPKSADTDQDSDRGTLPTQARGAVVEAVTEPAHGTRVRRSQSITTSASAAIAAAAHGITDANRTSTRRSLQVDSLSTESSSSRRTAQDEDGETDACSDEVPPLDASLLPSTLVTRAAETTREPDETDGECAEAPTALDTTATSVRLRRLSKAAFANGGDRHALLQESNAVHEGVEGEEDD